MKLTLLLADFAQVADGKLYISGGGWSVTGTPPSACALAVKIDVPWDQANTAHRLRIVLLDADGHDVTVETPVGTAPVEIITNFEVGRPPGLAHGTPIDVPLAFNVGPLPLQPGRYQWRASVDGEEHEEWRVEFSVRPART